MTAQIIPHDFRRYSAEYIAAALSRARYVIQRTDAADADRIAAADVLLCWGNWRDRHAANEVLNMIDRHHSGPWAHAPKPAPRRNYAGAAFAALVVAGVLIFATLAGAEALHRADAMIAAPMIEGFVK